MKRSERDAAARAARAQAIRQRIGEATTQRPQRPSSPREFADQEAAKQAKRARTTKEARPKTPRAQSKGAPSLPGWFETCCKLAGDSSIPGPVRAHALEAALEGVASLTPTEGPLGRGRVAALLQGEENQRLEVRLLVLQEALAKHEPNAPALEWSPKEHWRELSEPVLLELGFSRADADSVIDANIATDLDWLLKTVYGWPYAQTWRAAVQHVAGVRAWKERLSKAFEEAGIDEAAQREPHFDDLFSYDGIARAYAAFKEWAIAEARGTKSPPQPYFDLLGLVHHAVQDFYCHTNWVEICLRVDPHGEIPTWEAVHSAPSSHVALLAELRRSNTETVEKSAKDPRKHGGLQSGAWALSTFNGKRPWKHQHPRSGTSEHAAGLRVARSATKALTLLLESARK